MKQFEKGKFDSIILAGGFGKRLSPLTDVTPKPMLSLAGISAYERNISLLRRHGFNSTAVTTMYLPEKIERLKGNGVEYFRELTPLGSAGAVGKLKGQTSECFIVISGDAYCDFDLEKAKREFLKSNCIAAMLLSRTSDSGEYGSVCVQNGRIAALCEKPSVRDTLSDLINTGIYLLSSRALDFIPENRVFDFARDLFPALIKAGEGICAIEPEGHWFDVGSFAEYHRCNMWLSGGESCIGRQVSVHPEARIEHCVILDGCTIGNSMLRGCIVGEGAVIGNECIIPSGCVIGPNAEIRDGCVLAPGEIVGTGEARTGQAFVEYFKSSVKHLNFSDDSVISDKSDDGFFVHLGLLLGDEEKVIAFAEGGGIALAKACELACGAAEAGSGCTVISGGSASLAAFAAREYRSKTAYIFKNGEGIEIRLFSNDGMPLSREELRRLNEKTPRQSDKAGSVYLLPHGALIKRYLRYLKENQQIPKRINCDCGQESAFLCECAEELGIKADENGAVFKLSRDGERASATLSDGRVISYWQLLLICCTEGKKQGVILPSDTPDLVEKILKRHGIEVAFYNDSESDMRHLAEGDRLHRDGVLLSLTAASIAERLGVTLASLADRLPPFSVVTRLVFAERDKISSVISSLREGCGDARCAGFDFCDGRVNIYASASGRFRLIAEALDSETAEEITLRAIDKLNENK